MLKIYTNAVFHRHNTGFDHPERASRMDAAVEGIRRAALDGALVRDVDVHPETSRIIAKVHSADYDRELEDAVRAGYRYFHSIDNPISSASYAAAKAAVATSLAAAEDIWQRGASKRAFVIARPPGHHAERAAAMGFCFFNTIACVAEWLREQEGIGRVFIYDFDVHHGNGTQHLFETRDDVYYASVHRYPFYPGTGAGDEIGEGAGRGFTKNIPLEAGEGDAAFLRATEEIVRIVDEYKPHAILLSAGFDAHRRDPLGGMRVTEQGYGEITRRIVECAQRWCEGRVLSLLEGGYDMEGLSASVAEHVDVLAS